MKHAIISGTKVVNVIEWDGVTEYLAPTGTQMVPLEQGEFCEPDANYVANGSPRFLRVSRPSVWTAYQFLSRFTPAELDAVRVRSQTDSAMWRFLTFASAAQEIVSDDPVTMQGMDYLVSCGIVTQARRDAILSA